MSNVRKQQRTVEQRAQIVRRHVADKVPVSDLADEFGVQPSQIHIWVKQVLDQAEQASRRVAGNLEKAGDPQSMTEKDVETIVQRALEKYPGERPRIISDNPGAPGQFIARDFKEFIRLTGITHVRNVAALSAEQRQVRALARQSQARARRAAARQAARLVA